ncbi:MAG: hypothetical protein AAF487_05660 [Bacteroidota bacterium]
MGLESWDFEIISIVIGVLQIVFLIACTVIVLYLIVKRIESKQKETFEKRDN